MSDIIKILQNRENVIKTVFIKTVTSPIYDSIESFEENDPIGHSNFVNFTKKFNNDMSVSLNDLYLRDGEYKPAYGKLDAVTIGYFDVANDDTSYYGLEPDSFYKFLVSKRKIITIKELSELDLLEKFNDTLKRVVDHVGAKFICGFDISEIEIPFIIKKSIKYGAKVNPIFVKHITTKPWEGFVFDFKKELYFNGNTTTRVSVAAQMFDLKYKEPPIDIHEDKQYSTEELINNSKNCINLYMQLYIKLRKSLYE